MRQPLKSKYTTRKKEDQMKDKHSVKEYEAPFFGIPYI